MRINGYVPPKSSFLSMEKDTSIIVDRILKNERLKRLLYYNTPDALNKENLTDEQSIELLSKNIKLVPKLYVDGSVLNYIFIHFDNFTESENPEFRDNLIEIDIVCHLDQWQLNDFALRPYKIAGELDTILNRTKLTGIGQLNFLGATQIFLNNEYAGLCLIYQATHGGEDIKDMPNPSDEEKFLEDFESYLNG